MASNIVNTNKAPAAIGAYSQAVVTGNLLFTSGQLGLVPETGALPDDFETQVRQSFSNLVAICTAAGTSLDKAVKITIFLTDMNDFPIVNRVMSEVVAEPFPARSCFAVAALPKAAKVEIEAIVELP